MLFRTIGVTGNIDNHLYLFFQQDSVIRIACWAFNRAVVPVTGGRPISHHRSSWYNRRWTRSALTRSCHRLHLRCRPMTNDAIRLFPWYPSRGWRSTLVFGWVSNAKILASWRQLLLYPLEAPAIKLDRPTDRVWAPLRATPSASWAATSATTATVRATAAFCMDENSETACTPHFQPSLSGPRLSKAPHSTRNGTRNFACKLCRIYDDSSTLISNFQSSRRKFKSLKRWLFFIHVSVISRELVFWLKSWDCRVIH